MATYISCRFGGMRREFEQKIFEMVEKALLDAGISGSVQRKYYY